MKCGNTKYYKLCADIDFSQTDRKSDANSIIVAFKELDGDGHTISNYFGRRSSSGSTYPLPFWTLMYLSLDMYPYEASHIYVYDMSEL